MKWNRLLAFALCLSSLTAFASKPDKEYRKMIERLDVDLAAKSLDSCQVATFWATAVENNEELRKFVKDFQDDRKNAKKTLEKKAKLPHFYPQYDEDILGHMQPFCDSLLVRMGIADQYVNCSLHLVQSDDANAYTVLTDDGFAMCVTTGLFTKKGVDYDVLTGYVAREFAHGVLRHHDRALFAEARGGLGGGFYLGVGLLFKGFGVWAPVPIGTPGERKIFIPTGDPMQKYVFSYIDSQIFEADLMGLRFMENIGKADKYIAGMEILGTDYDEQFGHYFNQPDMATRMAFLSYVRKNPDLGNKINEKTRKKYDYKKEVIADDEPEADDAEAVAAHQADDKKTKKEKKEKKKKPKTKKNLDWAIDTM